MKDINGIIELAEKEISQVLEKLEVDTGMVLERIEVRDTDVTNIRDDRPHLFRRVVIEMKRLPGTGWVR